MSLDPLRLQNLESTIGELKTKLDVDALQHSISELETASMQPDFWANEAAARNVMQRLGDTRSTVETISTLESRYSTLVELSSIDLESGSEDSQELEDELSTLEKDVASLSTLTLFSGEYDSHPAIISIFAGQGGTEAMDWAAMLERMYRRFAETHRMNVETLEYSPAEEAGIKSVTLRIQGDYAYGRLKHESGTHRLVRLSPFNADNLRQTSFAGVEVVPDLEAEATNIEIKDADLEWQFFRSGGAGGQNVNKVNTAVRVRHLPTNLVVSCQSERSQEQNRKVALTILTGKLWALEDQARQTQASLLKGTTSKASFGSQIRNYVLHPYHLVKDTRTGYETSDTDSVLDGNLDGFIEAGLLKL